MIDTIIVLAYLILILIIGIIKRNSGRDFNSFTKITEKLEGNKLILVATIFATAIGGGTTFGIAEKVFVSNAAHSYGLILTIPIDIIIATFVVPKLIKHEGAETVGDIIYSYYGSSGRYIGGGAAILVSMGLLAAQISVSGRIFEYILQVDYLAGVIVSSTIIILYTTIGGLQSVIFTNQLQFFSIIFAIPVISIFGLYQIGFEKILLKANLHKFSFFHNQDLIKNTFSASLGFAVINLLPTFIQRVLINKDAKTTKYAIYIKSFIYFFFLIFITLNGLIAYIQYPNIKASLALPHLIDQIIPSGIKAFVIIGFLAAVMSTADADLNIISITVVKDFFIPIFKIKNQQYMLYLARISNIFIGIIAIIIALRFHQVVDLVMFIAGFWSPVILVPLIFGLFGIVITQKGFILSSIAGFSSFLIWSFLFEQNLNIKSVFVGTLAQFIIFLSLFALSVKRST